MCIIIGGGESLLQDVSLNFRYQHKHQHQRQQPQTPTIGSLPFPHRRCDHGRPRQRRRHRQLPTFTKPDRSTPRKLHQEVEEQRRLLLWNSQRRDRRGTPNNQHQPSSSTKTRIKNLGRTYDCRPRPDSKGRVGRKECHFFSFCGDLDDEIEFELAQEEADDKDYNQ